MTLPSWNLKDLYASIDDKQIDKDIILALSESSNFQEKYQNNLAKLSPEELFKALQKYEDLNELSNKPLIFAYLMHSADSSKPAHGALISRLEEKMSEIHEKTTFFNLEWNNLEDNIANKFIESPILEKYKHYLKSSRKLKPHQLTEKEEVLWQKVDLTAGSAWTRLFDEIFAKSKFKVNLPEPKELSEEEVLALLYSADREIRKDAANALTEGLKSNSSILTYIFNTLTQEHYIEDKIRKFEKPISSRNLSNEISDQSVEALMQVTEEKIELVHRFYKLKAKLLNLTELNDYDRYAPLPNQKQKKWEWDEACQFVLKSYESFSPDFAKIVKEFIDKNWIDADLREGKRGGAFSASTIPSVHPYILVNFTGNSRDLSTLAHELGHGIHQYLSRQVGYLESDTPLTTAETASVFGEMLTFDRLVSQAENPTEKLSLLITKLDEIIATVYRQVFMTRFEQKLHETRRKDGEFTTETINELWLKTSKQMFGDSVNLTDNYGYWWLYISHFIHSPFYCYAYAFGLLLSITLYTQSKTAGPEFKEQYTKILSFGGSLEPNELLKIANIDLNDNNFWRNGFVLIENMLDEAEKLAQEINLNQM